MQCALGERRGDLGHLPDRAAEFASASADRMVNSMLVPVSESATGNTLSRLISSVWVIRSPTAV